jgi:hypothetical protein
VKQSVPVGAKPESGKHIEYGGGEGQALEYGTGQRHDNKQRANNDPEGGVHISFYAADTPLMQYPRLFSLSAV